MSGNYSNDAIVYSYGYNDATGTLSSMMMSSAGVVGTVTPRYDSLGRMTRKTVVYNGNPSTELELFRNELSFNYRENNGYQSSLISQYVSTVHLANNQAQTTTYKYTYNGRDSITEIRDGNNAIQYKYYYDELGQLTREDNIAKNKTYTYAYDDAGNITSKKTYAFTTGDLGTASSTVNYTYGDATWGDLLTKYGTTNITYDEIGNPTKIGYYDLTWQGRELQSWSDDESTTVYYGYNADGIRTYKEILDDDTGCGTRHEYVLDGGTILYEIVYSITPTSKTEDYIVVYLYDESGSPVGMKYRTPSYGESTFDYYFFEKNLQGDIIAVYSGAGTKLCTFKYDAWGYSTISYESGVASSTKWFLRDHCTFRYRGYYYDTETGFYYLQSRYYNPTWGRFLNADGYLNANGDLIGFNMFAYCSNNPVMFVDPNGEIAISVLIAIGIGAVLGGIYGGVSAAANEQNVLSGIAIGAVTGGLTGLITEVASVSWMIVGTFAVGFAGDVASQMILDEKKFNDVNLISASWAGVANAGLSFMGKGLSKIDKMAGLSSSGSVIFGLMTNSPILALGMSINMLISKDSSVYTVNDLREVIFGNERQLEWEW